MFTTTAGTPRAAACSQAPPLVQPNDFESAPSPPMARRMLVDEKRVVSGYQLVTSGATSKTAGACFDDAGTAKSADSATRLAKPTFIRCTCRDLMNGQLDKLDPKTVVLEIRDNAAADSEGGGLDEAVLKEARGKGFKLAFDARLLKKEYAGFVSLASYIILEMGVMELDRAAALARGIRTNTKAVPMAAEVRTSAEYETLADAGVQLFDGHWYAQSPIKTDKSIQLSYAGLIKLLNLVMHEADATEIEELLKHEPTLAYKFLRYINSVGFGSNIEITSFRHAVLTVGLKKLFRWTALLITNTPLGSVAPAAGTLAIVRGRLMELLALETMSPSDADLAFVTGMFSMLDVLLGMPLEDALALVNLPKAITDAILSGDGPFAQHLAIAKACEHTDEALLEILSVRNRISSGHMIDTHLHALAWAEQFGH